jgi:nitrite reductase/ring-hydroxylating ferredoxin subunit
LLPTYGPGALRWLAWTSLLGLLALLSLCMLSFLRPASQKLLPDVAMGTVQIGERRSASVVLARQGEHWVGRVADFPPGSATHFQPRGAPFFFLIRLADGSFRALSDRSTHIDQRLLEWRDPLPGSSSNAGGPYPGLYEPLHGSSYLTDGRALQGPGYFRLGVFPVSIEGDRVVVGLYCTAGEWQPWQCNPKR